MAGFELAALTDPVSADDPCGPDLDLDGDPDFMNYMARAEGLLPATFFRKEDDLPFDRTSIDFAAEFKTAGPFLARTRDLRLLLLMAKYCALSRDLDGFVTLVGAVANLLTNHWDDVHPRGQDGDFASRAAAIETLDDSAVIIMPLQYMPIVQNRRLGAISYRSLMFANGEAQPHEGEESHDQPNIDRALLDETELSELVERRTQFATLQAALAEITKLCNDRIPSEQQVMLDKITALTGKIFGAINGIVARRDPSAAVAVADSGSAGEDAASAPAQRAAPFRSTADVVAALEAVDRYFRRYEPSNPALLLVRQAQQLIGKSFLEVMQTLIPEHVPLAKFHLGPDQRYEIPLERLAASGGLSTASLEAELHESAEQPADAEATEPPPEGETPPEAEAADAEMVEIEPAPVESGVEDGSGNAGNASGSGAARSIPNIETRQGAFALLDQVGTYYRVVEPSSPIALITDRARAFADRDFLTVLRELLPPPPST